MQRPSNITAPYILFVCGGGEGHARRIAPYLAKLDLPVLTLDHEQPPDLAVGYDPRSGWVFEHEGEALPPPAAVFVRFKMLGPRTVASEADAVEKLQHGEWIAFLRGLYEILGDRVLNAGVASHSKIRQCELAARAGFSVPEGRFFFGKPAAQAFMAGQEAVVMKAIGNPNTVRFDEEGEAFGDHLLTMAVLPETVRQADDSRFGGSPLWFQQQIVSGREFRIIVIGQEVFGGQEPLTLEERGLVDGRLCIRPHQPFTVDASLRRMLLDYMALAGLDYGVFDLIGDGERWWFLECNPDGQWHSAQAEDTEQVNQALCRLLVSRAQEALPLGLARDQPRAEV